MAISLLESQKDPDDAKDILESLLHESEEPLFMMCERKVKKKIVKFILAHGAPRNCAVAAAARGRDAHAR